MHRIINILFFATLLFCVPLAGFAQRKGITAPGDGNGGGKGGGKPTAAVVKGKVVDSENGGALSGVDVVLVGSSTSSATDRNGNFSIKAKVGDRLRFSRDGYHSQEFKVKSLKSPISIKLKKNAPAKPPTPPAPTTATVKGIVVNSDGNPLIGTSIALNGSSTVAVSGYDGEFSVKVKEGDLLRFTYIDYKPQEYRVKSLDKVIYIKMEKDAPTVETFTVNGVTFEMVRVEGGTFMMDSADSDPDAHDDEKPRHSERVGSFSIGRTEVTQALWKAVMGSNPSEFKGDNLPVERVSWEDCQEFITKLNRLTGRRFRLPTEAEWEYAARGGNRSKGYKYSGSNDIGSVAWYDDGNSRLETHPVGQKLPNELGLYDMTGNVWEWTSDLCSSNSSSYRNGGSNGSIRVIRGGSWFNGARYCGSAYRSLKNSSLRIFDLGFRLAL